MKKVIYFSIIMISIIGCNEDKVEGVDRIIEEFPNSVNLEAKIMEIPPILYRPQDMQITDSLLIVIQPRLDTIVRIFQLPNCELVSSFGKRGKGPDEFNFMDYNKFRPFHGDEKGFTLGERGTKIQYYSIKDILNNVLKPYKNTMIPPELSSFRAMACLSDSIILGAPYDIDDHIIKYNVNSKIIETILDYPVELPLLKRGTNKSIFGCYIAIKPDNKKFVITYASLGIIRIYDLISKSEFTIMYKDFPSLEDNLNVSKNSDKFHRDENVMVFCWGIKATDNYIYAEVYHDLYTNIADSKGPKRSYIPEIHVFDWSGYPIVKIKLDKYFSEYAIGSNDKYLYTIDDDYENIINRYDLSLVSPVN